MRRNMPELLPANHVEGQNPHNPHAICVPLYQRNQNKARLDSLLADGTHAIVELTLVTTVGLDLSWPLPAPLTYSVKLLSKPFPHAVSACSWHIIWFIEKVGRRNFPGTWGHTVFVGFHDYITGKKIAMLNFKCSWTEDLRLCADAVKGGREDVPVRRIFRQPQQRDPI